MEWGEKLQEDVFETLLCKPIFLFMSSVGVLDSSFLLFRENESLWVPYEVAFEVLTGDICTCSNGTYIMKRFFGR